MVEAVFYWTAFIDLLTTPKFENGPIPWDAVQQYANVHELDSIEAEDLCAIISKLDLELHELRKKKK